jgi:hypothetical protein
MRSNLMKLTLAVCAVMCYLSVDAVPFSVHTIYTHHNGEGSDLTDKEALGLLIALNIFGALVIVVRSIIWLIKKPRYTYIDYVLFSDGELITPDLNTLFLAITNGCAILVVLTMWIASIL